jgi:DNA-directed RNA polymerase specialized sigma24 family protein
MIRGDMVGRRFLGSDTSEGELLAAVAKGELDGLGEIYRRHGAAVLAAARKVVADAAVAEALTADVFVQLWDAPAVALDGRGLRGHLVHRVLTLIADEQHSRRS